VNWSILLPPLLALLALRGSDAPPSGPAEDLDSGISVSAVDFGRVAWGRNSLRARLRNEGDRAATLRLRVRSAFLDSGSGVLWEAAYPALVPPRQEGEITLDYFVRPDHGRLRVELSAETAAGRKVHEAAKEFLFEPPYRGDYVLQPYRPAREGVAWEGRVLPPFRVRESEHFIFYVFPGSEAASDLARITEQREKILSRLCRELSVTLPGKVVFFLYPDAELARKMTGHRGDGWTYGNTIVEVYGAPRKVDPHHELVHLVAERIGSPPVLFSEGFATAREKDFDNAGRYAADVEDWCRGFLAEGALLPLSELLEVRSLGEDLTRPRVAYPEAACFVRYLSERYGWDKFRRAYAELVGSENPEERSRNGIRFREIFGVSFEEAEADWREELSRARSRVPVEMIRRVVREETVPYLVARAKVLLTSGSAPEAERLLRTAVEKEPANVDARFWLGQALHLRKDYPGALAAYGEVAARADRTHRMQLAWSLVWSGQILDMQGKRQEALEAYRRAEALQEDSPVRVGGQAATSLEAAREGIAHPYLPPTP
jgi:tetratricopeptide (TPR) repeat protein